MTGADGSPRRAGVTVCIPTVRAATIGIAIESIRKQTFEDWELIVVMQGDDEELRSRVAAAERADTRIKGLWLAQRGVSNARSAGARAAGTDIVAFIDDDCEAAPDWLARVTATLDAQPEIGIVAGSLIASPRPRWKISMCPHSQPKDFTLHPDVNDPDLRKGSELVSANLAVRRWVWDAVGYFDSELGAGATLRGGEDLDFFLRNVRGEVPIRFLPEAVVHHTHGRRFGLREVWRMVTSYGYGQGAVAAKMTLTSRPGDPIWNGRLWRRRAWRDSFIGHVVAGRPHRIPYALPRLIAFERAYRQCLREYRVDESWLLVRSAGARS